MFNIITKLIHIVGKILFPYRCVGCKKIDTLLCSTCDQQLVTKNSEVENIITALSYSDKKVRQLIWLMKYKGSKEVTTILAGKIEHEIVQYLSDWPDFYLKPETILLVPIPMTKKHRRKRGWNQSALLAEAIAKLSPTSFQVCEALIKIKETKNQVHCRNKTERISNLQNAFALNPTEDITGKILIVVDDVVTTGTTIKEAMRTLKTKAPRRLLGAGVAHG